MAYPTGVSFLSSTAPIGSQPIHQSSTTQNHPLGTIIKAKDFTYGEGEFIYLKGVASTAQGDLVCFDQKAGTTVRAVHGGTGSNGPAAVAAAAVLASQYGWYQISGACPVKAGTVLANSAAYLTGTAGQIDDAVVSGDEVDGLTITAADSAGYATCQLSRPNVSGLGGTTGANSGDVTLGAIGSSPAAAGASLSGQVLTLQPADATHGGVIANASQTIPGAKTFAADVTFSGNVAGGTNFSGAVTFASSATLIDAKPNSVANGTGVTVADNGRATSGWLKLTIDKTAWVAAATTQDITLCTIPAKMRIVACYADTTVAYGGLAGTIAILIGLGSGGSEILASHDVKSAPVTKGLADADMGTAMTRAAAIQGCYTPSWSGTSNIVARLTSGVGNIGDGASATNLTTGSTTYYLKLELP